MNNTAALSLFPDQDKSLEQWLELTLHAVDSEDPIHAPQMLAPFIMEKFNEHAKQQESAMIMELLRLLKHEFKFPTLGRDDEDWKQFLTDNKIIIDEKKF